MTIDHTFHVEPKIFIHEKSTILNTTIAKTTTNSTDNNAILNFHVHVTSNSHVTGSDNEFCLLHVAPVYPYKGQSSHLFLSVTKT